MSILRLAQFELRRLVRGRLTAAALAVLTVIPLLYGALYLYAFWDPYANLDRIPVALVNDDQPARASDGSVVHAGQDLTDRLLDRRVFGWHITDSADADAGLRDGRYHLILTIPAGFSTNLAAAPDPDRAALPGELRVVSDDATNYLSGMLARSAFSEIRAAAAESTAAKYFSAMLIGFTDLKSQTGEASEGAGRLRDGARQSETGAGQLAGGLDASKAGSDRLTEGVNSAARGADQLAAGLTQLRTGADQLADGTAQAATGGRLLAGKVDAAADRAEPLLRENAQLIEQAANAIATGAETMAGDVNALPELADTALTQATMVQQRLDSLVAAHPELADDSAMIAARQAAAEAVKAARSVVTRLDDADLPGLRQRMLTVAATARKVAAAAPHLADDVAAAREQVDQLASGLDQLAQGAQRLRQGTGQAADGAIDLRDGLYRLATGARQLDGGLGQLSAGGHRLAAGLGQIEAGAEQLSDGLADGADKIPGYDDADARADVLADPVGLRRTAAHPATSYGVGFAPYFLGLALWVGAMITYMLLRPLNRRHVMSSAATWRIALAGWLPAAAIGLIQATVLFLVITLTLDLHPARPAATLGLMIGIAVAFTAIMQWLSAQFGPAGKLAALALLMLQLTSSGGTYPVETSPGFFQAIHPWLPMTYVVRALRHTINGGPSGPVITAILVLAGFTAVSLALTAYATRWSRRLTPATLHPELTL